MDKWRRLQSECSPWPRLLPDPSCKGKVPKRKKTQLSTLKAPFTTLEDIESKQPEVLSLDSILKKWRHDWTSRVWRIILVPTYSWPLTSVAKNSQSNVPFEIKFFNSRYSGIQQFANCQIFLLNLNLKKSILVSKFYKMFRNSAEQKRGIILLSFFCWHGNVSETPYYNMKFARKIQQQKEMLAIDNTGKQYFKWTCETRLWQCCCNVA